MFSASWIQNTNSKCESSNLCLTALVYWLRWLYYFFHYGKLIPVHAQFDHKGPVQNFLELTQTSEPKVELYSCEDLVALWVRSSVMVGNGAEAERVAMFCEEGSATLSNKLWSIRPSDELDFDPERSIEAAADVVDAIACAVGGSGWLCCPSYVATNTLRSSAHLCTYI